MSTVGEREAVATSRRCADKVDALRAVVSAYSQPNNSKAQTARVKKALLDLGFAGGDLVSAMVMLGWNEKDAT